MNVRYFDVTSLPTCYFTQIYSIRQTLYLNYTIYTKKYDKKQEF